jgi:hypothetical protein
MATNVSTALPDTPLPPGATITVTMSDVNAKVTLLNVYGVSPVTGELVEIQPAVPLFSYGPSTP